MSTRKNSKSNTKRIGYMFVSVNTDLENGEYEVILGKNDKKKIKADGLAINVRPNLFLKLFLRRPELKNCELSVVDLDPGKLKLKEGHSLIEIGVAADEKSGSKVPIEIHENLNKFSLYINPAAIDDFKYNFAKINEPEAKTLVSFKLRLSIDDTETIETEEIRIPLKVRSSETSLIVEPKLDQGPKYSIDLKEFGKCYIGELCLNHSSIHGSSPEIEATISCRNPKLVSLNDNKVVETNAVKGGGSLKEVGQEESALELVCEPKSGSNEGEQIYRVKHIRSANPSNEIKIPIVFDYSKIRNPREDCEEYDISFKVEYTYVELGQTITKSLDVSEKFSIKKNEKLNELRVECRDSLTNEFLELEAEYDWGRKILSSGLTHKCIIKLLNSAEVRDESHPDARVIIKNIKQKWSENSKVDDRVILNKEGLKPSQLFVLKEYDHVAEKTGKDVGDGCEYELFPLETSKDCCKYLCLEIKADDIKEIKRLNESFSADLELVIEFDYIIDLEGKGNFSEDEMKKFSSSIKWSMEREPNPGWLSVDFGTSAIVASYGENIGNVEDALLNINERKQILLERAYPDWVEEKGKKVRNDKNKDKRKDDTEPAPFIPSIIGLNEKNNGKWDNKRKDEDFDSYPLWLSPSPAMQEVILPCLKTLVGYRTLPNIFGSKTKKYTYCLTEDQNSEVVYYKDESRIHDTDDEKGLVYVNSILEEVYKQLFRHFICIDLKGGKENEVKVDKLNKLVLSVPNTFTPKHFSILRNVAKACFPNLRDEYLHVVSESDAVACSYLYLQNDFSGTNDIKDRLKSNENVLVYDMGAGTLDLTYFTKKKEGEKTEIEIKGKIGVNKAGNYLDYVIGEILLSILENSESKSDSAERFAKLLVVDKQARITQGNTGKTAEALKNFLKKEIKPKLNSPEQPIPEFDLDGEKLEFGGTVKDIVDSEKYKTYINECTYDVLDCLNSLLQSASLKLEVDTVVFSGRSTSLIDIRRNVAKYLKDQANYNVLCADFLKSSLTKLDDAIEVSGDVALNPLKTVVTFGSLVYSDWVSRPGLFAFNTNARVFARYGFLAKNAGNNGWQWHEMIKPGVTSCQEDSNVLFKETIKFNMQTAQELVFVQSYSMQTADDWTNGHKDMISEIFRYNVTPNIIGDGDKEITMKILKDRRIKCEIEGSGELNVEPHDDFNNESLRKSLWPVVF